MKDTLTPFEVGEYLNVHVRTIYRLVKSGKIPGHKVGGRWRFNKAALEEWLLEDNAQRQACSKPLESQFQQNSR
jgi:excisionase family DNA binding protein